MKKFLALMLLVVAAFAFAQTVNWAFLQEPISLNIWDYLGPNATVWTGYVLSPRYPGLYSYSDVRFDWVPSLAADLPEIVQEGDLWVYTVKLRTDAVWSDGTQFTADDVVWTLNTVRKLITDYGLGGNWASYIDKDYFVKAEKVDDFTVKAYFTQPSLAKANFGALMVPILQKKYWEPKIEEAFKTGNPLQTIYNYDTSDEPILGAFAFKRWEKGAFIEIEARDDYYDKGSVLTLYKNGAVKIENPNTGFVWTGYGEAAGEKELELVTGPYVENIVYRMYLNRSAAITALINGDVSFIFNSLGLQKGEEDQLAKIANVKIIKNSVNGFRYMCFNMRRFPMNIKEFRQAIAALVDREFLTSRVLGGQAFPQYGVVPSGNTFWYNPNVEKLSPGYGLSSGDRRKLAIDLLKKAGFRWVVEPKIEGNNVVRQGRGLIGPDGQRIEQIELLAPGAGYDPMRATMALYIERWANEIGIPIKANLVDFNLIVQRVFDEPFNFDIYMLGWSLSYYPDHVADFFHSRRSGVGDFNAAGYNNPEFDKLADEFLAASDINKARELSFKLQEILAEDLPYLVLFDTPVTEAYRSDQVVFPYEKTLSGLQYVYGTPTLVKAAE
ncbi:ABC transporter substrate-binding protein [Pseudothermotoga lettingae]|jgi:ABC-type transport system substrate-binding protein|uniref:Extracellular solute-binding protein family 5 n=1 Tax=Pseudothermotoga lettingae (strain ATCC BAA-301 / DSM 14385 / NBRC 107922 / TMO) TaxID=416591 RepID=A8F8S8_PSELT|nr:ABC transporter substrate-binding protein [Pseudothermotoga lettingae]ABV34562.1 extracellular solute-binding protein family 5 [Pseudothermotoga lettingae TMO]MDI3494538.1 peptide/nickel transport system substrate-binding protein [Pseudothermotoga sp.]GLI48492.1 peptide ABC transporter substrate-binding protein [Pseudothermotoga lettingae TMO]